ncbi:cytochrome P450-like protein [Arabidopsis thaliana]|uniref:Cytochrome P450 71A21 n=1 Tax=Arabidopsis thaliana TaxID=3702 RepID=C71AL_ARATH|nr:cytochrome P450, family 71, subfamily A, polypeptide 21 [Arabidopsis thaliana]Q9STL2.1 RecName: Full=Cytochrome P450 71A21 [Arabidopsis thaliana]AEE78400.1 cytochrome P450, family 71, subfamily A, polypeptide 21 [Arabidopsis thaliana]CAB41166.1 cytochrome P450-like protein [Arabidopsis thaliana]|eukprot:NP_680111.1 cytochrome P450, family 71, subfamily A, polypeptide 21 [Arabidopsis thaliana]
MESMTMIILQSLIIFITILFFKKQKRGKKSNTPRSPPRLPLIGNLHQLGHHPHRSLCSLSHRYGPLMLLHLGRVPVLVVSSADVARDILKTHDRVFASRPRSKLFEKLFYDGRDVAFAPYGEYWRQIKSVCVLRLLSNKMVTSFRNVRQEEISLMMEKIQKSSSLQVNVSELLGSLTNDVISRIALGRKYSGETDSKELMKRLMMLMGEFSVGTYVPWLGWIDWISGLDGQLNKTGNDLDEFLEKVVQDHVDGDGQRTDFVDVLLRIQREKSIGFEIDRLCIKAIVLDVLVAGTDSSYALMDWAMTELLRHPECLRTLQEEVRTICKGNLSVSEEDIQNMSYLKAVIKETTRLHPPLPLLAPHESIQDVILGDYHIPAGTQVMINAWAIGREAATWGPDAEKFRPERHLDSSVDFRGHNFELVPFGAGRRICPAISFAVVLIEVALANFVHRYDWKLPEDSKENQTNVAESTGMVIHRLFPLYAIASSTT